MGVLATDGDDRETRDPSALRRRNRHVPGRYGTKYFDEQEWRKQYEATISVEHPCDASPSVLSLCSIRDKVGNIR